MRGTPRGRGGRRHRLRRKPRATGAGWWWQAVPRQTETRRDERRWWARGWTRGHHQKCSKAVGGAAGNPPPTQQQQPLRRVNSSSPNPHYGRAVPAVPLKNDVSRPPPPRSNARKPRQDLARREHALGGRTRTQRADSAQPRRRHEAKRQPGHPPGGTGWPQHHAPPAAAAAAARQGALCWDAVARPAALRGGPPGHQPRPPNPRPLFHQPHDWHGDTPAPDGRPRSTAKRQHGGGPGTRPKEQRPVHGQGSATAAPPPAPRHTYCWSRQGMIGCRPAPGPPRGVARGFGKPLAHPRALQRVLVSTRRSRRPRKGREPSPASRPSVGDGVAGAHARGTCGCSPGRDVRQSNGSDGRGEPPRSRGTHHPSGPKAHHKALGQAPPSTLPVAVLVLASQRWLWPGRPSPRPARDTHRQPSSLRSRS